ncbi:MAG: hypothetical protein GYA02_14065 [Clostridiaceae bacterium]|jgi:hypothetical protein|nr:hypothetical protein [Clostridiaceae bacterium]
MQHQGASNDFKKHQEASRSIRELQKLQEVVEVEEDHGLRIGVDSHDA